MTHAPESVLAGKQRPFTGAEFIESLRDGREVYIYGDRVKDVTKHPAFRNAAASVARLYDALHDPKTRDALTAPTDTGSAGYTAGAATTITTARTSRCSDGREHGDSLIQACRACLSPAVCRPAGPLRCAWAGSGLRASTERAPFGQRGARFVAIFPQTIIFFQEGVLFYRLPQE